MEQQPQCYTAEGFGNLVSTYASVTVLRKNEMASFSLPEASLRGRRFTFFGFVFNQVKIKFTLIFYVVNENK